MTSWILPWEMKAGRMVSMVSGLQGLAVECLHCHALVPSGQGSVPFILPYSMAPPTCWSCFSRCRHRLRARQHRSLIITGLTSEAQADVGQKDACWPWVDLGLGSSWTVLDHSPALCLYEPTGLKGRLRALLALSFRSCLIQSYICKYL